MMADPSTTLRLLEVIAILLPITGIFAQAVLRMHSTELVEIEEWDLQVALFGIILAAIMLLGAGIGTVVELSLSEVGLSFLSVLMMLVTSLFLLLGSVYFLGGSVARFLERDEQQKLTSWSDDIEADDGE